MPPLLWSFISGLSPLPAPAGASPRRTAVWLLLFLLAGARPASAASAAPASPLPLTSVQQVHQLSPELAAQHPVVHLQGIVTSGSTWPKTFFLQDKSGGIAVGNKSLTNVSGGEKVDIVGEASPGLFAPVVHAQTIHVLAKGTMPPARLFTYQELLGGDEDSSWIAVRGVVHSAQITTAHGMPVLSLVVEVNASPVTVQFLQYTSSKAEGLIDATVLIHGVCTTTFNDKQQFVGASLQVPSMAYMHIEERASRDPYQSPRIPVRSLLRFRPGVRFDHRLQIAGRVTYQDLGHSLYVQDGTDGVLITTEQQTPVALGTMIEAVGFASPGAYSPVLRDGSFRVVGHEAPLLPVSIRAQDLLRKNYFVTAPFDAQLVKLQGQLVEKTSRLKDVTWILRDGENQLTVVLERTPGTSDPVAVEDGSIVAVTGIFATQVDENRQPTAFRILLRSAADLAVVKHAPWWNAGHSLIVLCTVLVGTLIIALWGAVLRRTVLNQTRMLRESEERFRNQAQHDALTGLVSRSFLRDQLSEDICRAKRSNQKMAILMIDLDHFKQVNDTLGHHAGDELLCLVAQRIRDSVRKTDTVGRMGGDEFVVLLTNLHTLSEAEEIGAKVVANVSAPAEIAGRFMPISASVGVCLYPNGGTDTDTLLQNVDAAMYKAKAAGRNSFAVYVGDKAPASTHPHFRATASVN